ncbi:MAG: succinate dehydrogenase, partial [Dehalococcoidia bacterium]|nr:succinate dehydrogenase [Dehalococcoidia bacterium]
VGMMLTTAQAMASAALERRESRGGHIRLDYPKRDDDRWFKNIILWKEGDGLRLRSEAVPPREVRS